MTISIAYMIQWSIFAPLFCSTLSANCFIWNNLLLYSIHAKRNMFQCCNLKGLPILLYCCFSWIGHVLRYFERVFVATFFSNVAEIDIISYLLPVARSYLFQVAKCPLFLTTSTLRYCPGRGHFGKIGLKNFPLKLIVAGCNWDFSNCCMLRPKTRQLLRIAGYLNTSQYGWTTQ